MIKKKQLEAIETIQEVPTEYQKRPCTDIFCLIFGVVFSIVLIVLAAALFNYKRFYQANFPADSDGKLCGIDNSKYEYVYFTYPPDISKRVCVENCPKPGDEALKCAPTNAIGCRFTNNTGFQVIYYQTKQAQTRSGFFCEPTDQSLKQKLLENSNLSDRQMLYKSLDTIILCFFVALGFSILYMVLVQFFPKGMNYAAVILGWLAILASAICLFTYNTSENIFRTIVGLLLILILIIIAVTFIKNQASLKIHGIFLNYSTKFIKDRPITLAYIPLFLLFLVAFITIVVLQFNAYWTTGELSFSPKEGLFHKPIGAGPIVLSVLLGIQTIWGLVFLKMAFNFCVSGQAVLWYYNKKKQACSPFKLLICKHFGSVIGGSFIIAFFTFFDFVVDFIKPNQDGNPDSCYNSCFNRVCGTHSLFDLVRTDSMAYINLTGNPFCNSARYCEYLCNRSVILDNSQSSSRVYRLCAHFLLGGIMVIFALYIKGVISTYALIIIVINTIFVSTLFISLHADATQAISIIFLADQELARRNNKFNPDYSSRFGIENNLNGVKMHQEIVEQVKKQRLQQFDKQNARQI